MTTANLKLATVEVTMEDELETPDQQLDAGEFIVKRVVPLQDLVAELKGEGVSSFRKQASLTSVCSVLGKGSALVRPKKCRRADFPCRAS
jgi:hypothetical protein